MYRQNPQIRHFQIILKNNFLENLSSVFRKKYKIFR